MTFDLINCLYVFVLAGFIGFEVIRRVSPLLHTPLMSLTNALDAIVVVAAIIIAGRHESTLSTVLGAVAVAAAFSNMVGGFLITDRMLRMFKLSKVQKTMNHLLQQQLIDVAYIVAVALFVLALKWLSSPATAKHGVLAGEFGAVLAVTATLCNYRDHRIQMDHRGAGGGRDCGHPAGPGAHDRGAAADRSQPRFWRAGGGDDRHCRVLRAHSPPHANSRWWKSRWK